MKITILAFFLILQSCQKKTNVLFDKDALTSKNWTIEQQPEGTVVFANHKMEITDAKGCTVWFNHKLEGPIKIEYDATVIDADGPFDRVSDLNCFWMANDPNNPSDFFKNSKVRAGKFNNYHTLTQYYVGYGGHNNTKTRFRRYNGKIERPLLPEHDLNGSKFTITPNKKMHITLIAKGNRIIYLRNNEIIFTLDDPTPYKSGYFGIRTVNNHMLIENLKISSEIIGS